MGKILGIDLGTGSIGIALRNTETGKNLIEQLEYFSSDIFQSGVGKDKTGEYSLAAERTKSKQSRKLKDCRRNRLWSTLQLLIDYDLCPMSQSSLDQWRTYDKSKGLYRKYPINDKPFDAWIKLDFNQDGKPDYSSPYQLRRELATVQIDFTNLENRYKLGRALYHIAQRRGFKSSKGETISSQENETKDSLDLSDKDITQEMQKSESKKSQLLASYMKDHNYKTVGEAFAALEDEGKRIRASEYAAVRKNYEDEIISIFNFQDDLQSETELLKRLRSKKKGVGTIFYKKPLKSQKWAVGRCTLEKNKTRCPISHPEFEKFRAWSFMNNIKIRKDSTSEWETLSIEIKQDLYNTIFTKRVKTDFDFKEIRERLQKLLNRTLDGNCAKDLRTINYKDKHSVSGCPVIARLINLLGDEWESFCMTGKKQRTSHSKTNTSYHIVEYSALDIWHICYETDDPEYLTELAHNHFDWNDEQTKKLLRLWSTIRPGYAMLSLKAIKNINRMLAYGLKYSDAVLLAKIPDIAKISEEEIISIVSEYNSTIKTSIDNAKLIYSIINSLIANYKSLDYSSKFAFHDFEYNLQKSDIDNVQRQIEDTIGKKSWELMDDTTKQNILTQVCNKYQDFFHDYKRDFYRIPKISDALKQYLINKYPSIKKEKWDRLYHPSQISIYKTDHKDVDKRDLRLGSPSIGAMRNPVARRTLNILRRKINAMLDAGLIDTEETRIVVETTRTFNDANKRWAIEKYQEEREKENKTIKEILQEFFPTRDITEKDIDSARDAYEQPREGNYKYKDNKNRTFGIDTEKYKLWKEQGGKCIYTGQIINISQLFDENRYDIEHTIPRSLSFDNSDQNLTICDSYYNRFIKKNQIPTELPNYDKDAIINGKEYTAILPRLEEWRKRVERLKDNVNFWKAQSKRAFDKTRKDYCIRQRHLWQMELDYWHAKLERFMLTEVKEGFRNSQLVDTGIITKYATLYLKSIFNSVDVQKGSATAEFRKMLGVQSLEEKKDRSLHSHHAIDATVLTLIPVAAKRQRMLKLFYDIEEAKALGHEYAYLQKQLTEEINECCYGKDVAQVTKFIEDNIIVKHHTSDRTFSKNTPPKKLERIPGGDSVRGRLHAETFFGAVKLPLEVEKNTDKTFKTNKGKFVYPEKQTITMVVRTLISTFKSIDDLATIIDPYVRHSLSVQIQQRLDSGLSFKEAINQPLWLIDKNGNEIRRDKHGRELSPIRHIRCKVKAGRGYMTHEKSLTIRQHLNISEKRLVNINDRKYKQNVYAQNDTNYLYLLYEGTKKGIIDRKSRIINLWEATMLHRDNPDNDIVSTIHDTFEYNHIKDKNIEYKLAAIIKVGDYVLLWKDTPDELKDMDSEQISKKLYTVYKFNNTGSDTLYLRHHQSTNTEPDFKLTAKKMNCMIEHRDFEIDILGRITFKN